MAGIAIVASESMKHAASRPSPPLPRPASGSCSMSSASFKPLLAGRRRRPAGDSIRLVMLFASDRPIRNSIER